jgi:hypothetical protein
MAGVPTGIRLEALIELCKFYGYGTDILELVLFFDRIAYPIKYPPKT